MLLTVLAVLAAQSPEPEIISAGALTSGRHSSSAREELASHRIGVEIAGGGKTLWQGTLRVSRFHGASFNQTLSQASNTLANRGENHRGGSSRDSLMLNLSGGHRSVEQPNWFSISINWVRSDTSPSCGSHETPARTVGLTDTASLIPGRPVRLSGDGGLVVTLRLEP